MQAYRFNAHWYEWREIYRSRLAALRPLGYNPYATVWMTRPHEFKMLEDQRYLVSWYTSIGHAEVVVLLYTVL